MANKNVVSYGAGTNSTAMIIEMVRRGISIDAVVFADTGAERPATYDYVVLFSEWLVSHGYPSIVTVRNDGKWRTLENECRSKNLMPPITYGFSTCSDKYKRRPFKKWLKSTGWENVTVCIGFDAGETRRAKFGPHIRDSYHKRYPLIESGIDRAKCINIIRNADLPLPGKSSCFFCPSTRPSEIIELRRNYPDLFARAVEMERSAKSTMRGSIRGLGRNFSWERFITFRESQLPLPFFVVDCPCGCFEAA
jgi:hypothetical protein